jgi:GT2 family glycosyltransferase
MKIRVSILTIFWKSNVEDFLLRYLACINSLLENNKKNIEIKVYLLDNSPVPTLLEYIKSNGLDLPKSFEIIEKNIQGFAGGNNYLAKRAYRTFMPDYFLFLNPDTELDKDALKYLISVCKGNVFSVDARQFPFEHPKEYNPITLETSWCSGACLLTKAKEFVDWSGFDENFFMYAEDVDLSWRAWERGYKCLYQPKAICIHNCYGLSKDGKFRQFWNIRNNFLMRFKHGNRNDFLIGLKLISKTIFLLLKNKSFGECLNLTKALLLGTRYYFKYLKFKNNVKTRPLFADFFGFDYARIMKLKYEK